MWDRCKLQLCRCELFGVACLPGNARSIDFCAASQSGKLNKRTGTPLYMAPELFMRYYGVESDQVITAVFCKGLLCKAMRSCCETVVEYKPLNDDVKHCRLLTFCGCNKKSYMWRIECWWVSAVGAGHHDVPDAVWPPAILECSVRSFTICCDVCNPQCRGEASLARLLWHCSANACLCGVVQ